VTKGDGEANRASRSKHNLPYQLTSFVGREQEIAQLEESRCLLLSFITGWK
jgi:hypothetical protein